MPGSRIGKVKKKKKRTTWSSKEHFLFPRKILNFQVQNKFQINSEVVTKKIMAGTMNPNLHGKRECCPVFQACSSFSPGSPMVVRTQECEFQPGLHTRAQPGSTGSALRSGCHRASVRPGQPASACVPGCPHCAGGRPITSASMSPAFPN